MNIHLKIAAKMLNNDGDIGLVNSNLINELNAINRLCQHHDGILLSRQAIAVAIINWKSRNPHARAYGE